MNKFDVKEQITMKKIIQSEPCKEELQGVLNFLLDNNIISINTPIPNNVLDEAFNDNDDWFEYAIKKGWITVALTKIDPDYLYVDKNDGHLWDIIQDDENDMITLINITGGIFKSEEYDNLIDEHSYNTGLASEDILEVINDHFGLELEETNLRLKDIIYKKYIPKSKTI